MVPNPALTQRQELGPKSSHPANLNPNLQRNQRPPLIPRRRQRSRVSVKRQKVVMERWPSG